MEICECFSLSVCVIGLMVLTDKGYKFIKSSHVYYRCNVLNFIIVEVKYYSNANN